jgi:hypothetical protein
MNGRHERRSFVRRPHIPTHPSGKTNVRKAVQPPALLKDRQPLYRVFFCSAARRKHYALRGIRPLCMANTMYAA